MHIFVHNEIPNDAHLRDSWSALARRSREPQVFYTYEWAASVTQAFGSQLNPLLFTAFENGELVGVVALAAEYSRGEASFLSGTTADYCDFICDDRVRRVFIGQVLDQLEKLGLPTLTLANLPADSPTGRALRSVGASRGFSVFTRPAYYCARVSFASPVARMEARNVALRKQVVRRHYKALAKLGKVEVNHLENQQRIEAALPQFSSMHVARFLAGGRISNLARPERRVFLSELTKQLSERKEVVLSALSVDGHAIAWNYGFRFGGSWFWYQPTFATDFQQFSPGLCLLAKIIEDASQDPEIHLVDLGLGAEDYKDRWANSGQETLHLVASRSPAKYSREVVRYHVTKELKRSPYADRLARKVISRMSAFVRQHGNSGKALRLLKKRIQSHLEHKPEVCFFESANPRIGSHSDPIIPITLDLLAQAVVQYQDDEETLNYLRRSAERVISNESRGFALLDIAGRPVHFCWIRPFDQFYVSELKKRISSPCAQSLLIFDCWTPHAMRRSGYYSTTIAAVAERERATGNRVWMFAASTNRASLQGIRNAGFAERFSVALRRSGLRKSAVYQDLTKEQNAMVHVSSVA